MMLIYLAALCLAALVIVVQGWREHRRMHPELRGYDKWLRGLPPQARFTISERLLRRHYRQIKRQRLANHVPKHSTPDQSCAQN